MFFSVWKVSSSSLLRFIFSSVGSILFVFCFVSLMIVFSSGVLGVNLYGIIFQGLIFSLKSFLYRASFVRQVFNSRSGVAGS